MTPVRFVPPLLLLVVTLNGCGTTPPPNYYLLGTDTTTPARAATQHVINIGLGPIEFPAYLDRNEIVVSSGDHRLRTAEYHRWAEPLASNFARILAQNLMADLPEADVHNHPWRPDVPIDVEVRLNVLKFNADDRNQAHLSVRWELIDRHSEMRYAPQNRDYLVPAEGDDYEALVKALSRCVGALSDDLAENIRQTGTQTTHQDQGKDGEPSL